MFLASAKAVAYQKPISLDDIYGPGAKDAESLAEYDEDLFALD